MTTKSVGSRSKGSSHAPATCPGSPGSGAGDHHSDLTGDSAEDEENFISLLEYRDARHILNIAAPESSELAPETVQNAYDVAKEQTLVALEQFEEKEQQVQASGGGRSMFFISQKNYLELKLQALDQAYEELMPLEHQLRLEDDDGGHHHEEGNPDPDCTDDRDTQDVSSKRSQQVEVDEAPAPSSPAREYVWDEEGDTSTNAAAKSIKSSNKDSPQRSIQQLQHRRVPSEDELDTIDIYFQPSPTKNQSLNKQDPNNSGDQPSDVSACTWDGSSIFSMISQTKKNIEDAASLGELSDVLGPKTTIADAGVPPIDTVNRRDNDESRRSSVQSGSSRRPPSGINDRRGPRAQISPKSVTDFPASIHNDQHYDNSSGFHNRGKMVGRGKMMKGTRHAASHEATEAARMGILRALSEDNSECLPLDDDDHNGYLNISTETTDAGKISEEAKYMKKRYTYPRNSATYSAPRHHAETEGRRVGSNTIDDNVGKGGVGLPKSKRYFQGKSDNMSKDNNSLLASVLNDGSTVQNDTITTSRSFPAAMDHRDHGGTGTVSSDSMRDGAMSPKSLPPTVSPSPRRHQQKSFSNNKSSTAKTSSSSSPNDNANDDKDHILFTNPDSYDDLLQSGMDLADELCMALNNCFKGGGIADSDMGFAKTLSRASSAASAAFDAATSELDRSNVVEEESTVFTRSTADYDDSTYHTRSVYTTDGESTAFNTMSSFSRRDSPSPTFMKNRKMLSKANGGRSFSPNTTSSGGSSDPPPRMLV